MSAFDPSATWVAQDFCRARCREAPISLIAVSCFDGLSCKREIWRGPSRGETVRRRDFIKAIAGSAAAWPLAARAQQTNRIARVGVLGPGLDVPQTIAGHQVFLAELRKLGFTEGGTLTVEHRRTDQGMPKAFTGANE